MRYFASKLMSIILLIVLLFPTHVFSQREKAFEINQKLGRGINYGNMFEGPTETAWGNQWKPQYAGIIAELGFNHVRIPIRWEPSSRSSAQPPYTISTSFLNRIKVVVDSAINNSLYVLINMHHHEALYEDPDGQKERFISQWGQISEFFKAYPENLLFEILNEPHGNLDAERWNIFLADALNEIRKTNQDRIVVIGTAEYGGLGGLSKLQLPDDENIILTAHYYSPFHFTHQGASWVGDEADDWLGTEWTDTDTEREVMRQDFAPLLQVSQQKNIPIHIGEFGAYNTADIDSREKWTTFLARYFEELGWSWAYWEFSAGFGIYNPSSQTYNTQLVDALLNNAMAEPAKYETTAIYTSNFQSSNDGWFLNKQGGASAQLSRENNSLNITISNGGSENWHVQLVKNQVRLYKDKKYKISFSAKADGQRTLTMYAGKSSSPWSAYSGYESFTISDTFKEYSTVFDMTETDTNSRLVFDLGKSVTDIIITEISLEELALNTSSQIKKTKNIKIFPNPVTNSFRISGSEPFDHVSLYNLSGDILFSEKIQNDKPLSISFLKSGIYILKLIGKNNNYICKLLKE